MNDAIIRCPNCQTAFHVSNAQRAAADGLVRCGVCARVFDAGRHAALPQAPDHAPADAPPAPAAIDAEEAYIRGLFTGEGSDTETPKAETPDAVTAPAETPEAETADATTTDAAAVLPGTIAAAFVPPPVEIEAVPAPRRMRHALWALGCLVAVMALGAQYGWHEREHLLQDRTVRPWIDQACRILHCTLPHPALPGAIRSDALAIRLAPDRDGVLLVDARLANHAPYPQPWPRLAISFQDMRGHTVAGRVFDATQYLPSPPAADMPAGPLVPIHLELRDPGEHAAGYRMDILPASTPR